MTTPARAGRTSVEKGGRSAQKRQAILKAATEIFLKGGYLGANMDEIAARASVSKQTVYKQFSSKEALFVAVVRAMTDSASDAVQHGWPELAHPSELEPYLIAYAERQLDVVLTPRIMQLRRLVIGEVERFPDLAAVLYAHGPQRALDALASMFARFTELGLLTVTDADQAAAHFNWLVMGEPINRAMLLGVGAIPTKVELRHYAQSGVRVFLAAYGAKHSGLRDK